jgi:ribosomal protein S18 acetylase RimI-like enzyme
MVMAPKIQKRHLLLLILLGLACAGVIFYYFSDQRQSTDFIRAYDQEKDFAPLVSMINDNMFWLSERPDFSPEQFLLLRAPNFDPSRKGQTTIDVLESENATAGFIAFHKKSPTQGYIWIFAVGKDFRRRGFGEKLLYHALAQLKKQGATYVTLTTRLAKTPAVSLYKKVGFVEQFREEDRGIITLIKRDL